VKKGGGNLKDERQLWRKEEFHGETEWDLGVGFIGESHAERTEIRSGQKERECQSVGKGGGRNRALPRLGKPGVLLESLEFVVRGGED